MIFPLSPLDLSGSLILPRKSSTEIIKLFLELRVLAEIVGGTIIGSKPEIISTGFRAKVGGWSFPHIFLEF